MKFAGGIEGKHARAFWCGLCIQNDAVGELKLPRLATIARNREAWRGSTRDAERIIGEEERKRRRVGGVLCHRRLRQIRPRGAVIA